MQKLKKMKTKFDNWVKKLKKMNTMKEKMMQMMALKAAESQSK